MEELDMCRWRSITKLGPPAWPRCGQTKGIVTVNDIDLFRLYSVTILAQ
jgi:hypothetical protein